MKHQQQQLLFGCEQVLFELLTGLPAFDDKHRDDQSLVSNHCLLLVGQAYDIVICNYVINNNHH